MCEGEWQRQYGMCVYLIWRQSSLFIMDWGALPLSSYPLIRVKPGMYPNLWPCLNSLCVKSMHRTLGLSLMDAYATGEQTLHLMKSHYCSDEPSIFCWSLRLIIVSQRNNRLWTQLYESKTKTESIKNELTNTVFLVRSPRTAQQS